MTGNSPTTTRQNETKLALLKAGAVCFARKGYAATGVREICEMAKANPAAVNYHFGGKQEFYRAVLLNEFENAGPPPPVLMETADTPEQQLRAFVGWFVDRMLRNKGNNIVRDILNHELREPTGGLQMLIEHSMRPIGERLEGIVSALMGGQADERLIKRISITIFGQCIIYKQERGIIELMHGEDFCDYADVEEIADFIYRFTLAGIRASAGKERG